MLARAPWNVRRVSPQSKEAAIWIGGALLVALAVGAWLLWTSPPFDELATRYSIL